MLCECFAVEVIDAIHDMDVTLKKQYYVTFNNKEWNLNIMT